MQDQIGETSENHVSPFKTPDYKKKKKAPNLIYANYINQKIWLGLGVRFQPYYQEKFKGSGALHNLAEFPKLNGLHVVWSIKSNGDSECGS